MNDVLIEIIKYMYLINFNKQKDFVNNLPNISQIMRFKKAKAMWEIYKIRS